MAEKYDLAVIGSGPGGYVAAIRAAQLGLKVACIDKRSSLGGTCLNVGCIPSKSLLQSTEFYFRLLKEGKDLGIECPSITANFSRMMERKDQIVKNLTDGISSLFQRHNISQLHGTAAFTDPHRLKITSDDQPANEIVADSILIATGSEPIPFPELPFDEKQVLSSTGALELKQIPKRLLVIGGGVIGVELASVYNRLGSKVSIIEMLDRICPAMDQTISTSLFHALKKQGLEFYLSSEVVTSVVQPEEVILTVRTQETLQQLSGEALLVSIGRRPCTKGLMLEKASVQTDKRGFIPVDGQFRTSQSHIFAIGDVIEGTMLAHRASAEGVAVAELLKGGSPRIDYLAIPNVIYTDPEAASVGLTEQEAKEAGLDLMTGKSFFRGNPRARCSGEIEGVVKIIGDKRSGRLIGMHITGPHASELIAEGMAFLQMKAQVEDLADAPNAHPTLSETIKESALDALKRAIHH